LIFRGLQRRELDYGLGLQSRMVRTLV